MHVKELTIQIKLVWEKSQTSGILKLTSKCLIISLIEVYLVYSLG